MYSIVPCSKSYESIFFIFRQFWAENVIEREICWEKNVFLCHFKVIQGQSRSFGFIIFFVSPLAIMWSKMMRIWKCLTKTCPHMLPTWQFGPIWPHSVSLIDTYLSYIHCYNLGPVKNFLHTKKMHNPSNTPKPWPVCNSTQILIERWLRKLHFFTF